MRAANQDNERYEWRTSGKGRIAFAKSEFDDPWVVAQESVLLISHRYDLLRFWNGGSVGSYFTVAPDRKRALVQILFYAERGLDDVGRASCRKLPLREIVDPGRKSFQASRWSPRKTQWNCICPGWWNTSLRSWRLNSMHSNYTRREWLKSASMLGGACLAGAPFARAAATPAPTAAVSVARCRTYEPKELLPVMARMFDQIGGVGKLVKGKTVAIKFNLTGMADFRLANLPLADTHFTHPAVVGAAVNLIAKAGAARIRVLESVWATTEPIEEFLLQANLEPGDILGAGPNVEFENTNYLGKAKQYSRLMVPTGGYIYPGFDLNHSLCGLRCVRQHRQDEGTRDGRLYRRHEELLWNGARHYLWQRCRRR